MKGMGFSGAKGGQVVSRRIDLRLDEAALLEARLLGTARRRQAVITARCTQT